MPLASFFSPVGWIAPTVSHANGALVILIPHAHNTLKKRASNQNMKYRWTALEAPKVSGKAFHWIPVCST
jgi:hypothetical protein